MNRRRRSSLRSIEIFSIFGQCEAAAAQHLIDQGIATKIEAAEIPSAVATNELGQRAFFAVIVPRRHVPAFNKLCMDMRA